MRNFDKIALVVLIGLVLVLGFQFRGQLTGMVVSDDNSAPQITIAKLDALKNSASIKWQTDKAATSYFQFEGKTETFGSAKEFEISLEKLEAGKQYSYTISACDRKNNCNQRSTFFTTLTQDKQDIPKPITGAAVTNVSGLGISVNRAIFILLLIAASVILVGGFMQEKAINILPPSIRLGMMLDKAETLIKEKRHEELHSVYGDIRVTYERLNAREKGKHQMRALDVYSELLAHSRAKEANILVDKYLEGKINKDEVERLRELIDIE